MKKVLYSLSLLFVFGCASTDDQDRLFERLSPTQTNVVFENILTPTEEFNMYIFRNFYNGGGVAAGDVTGNGYPDLFFTGNMTSNRLYKNRGDYQFEDITESAGLLSDGYWSTGASMVDINGNGLLDIFVTLSGPPEGDDRHNRLYINNGDGTFTDKAKEYGIADIGLSTHVVFFDYNGSGLLDMYLINNSFRSVGGYEGVTGETRKEPDPRGASKLYRNEGGYFTDVTEEAGIYSSIIGFGLSATVADINRNGLPDLYVANDFFERDYLYINNGNGTFTESLEDKIRSLSFSSMGSDIADLNNDGWPDIYVSDMLPEDQERLKSKMTIETWDEYQENIERGFHYKYTRNTLQLNRGDGSYSEIGRLTNTHATDWSWAVLLADFDLNGYNDIFVANGIYKDLLDQDYIEQVANPRVIRQMIEEEGDVIMRLMEQMSSVPISNYIFANRGELNFENKTSGWGLDNPGFSSGAAWADLNGNGVLDLIVNNVNGPSEIYRNRADKLFPERTWLKVNLEGDKPNTLGIGAQLEIWSGDQYWYREHILQRGFQSSVEPGLHVGLNETKSIDSLKVRWPDGRISRIEDIDLPASITVSQDDAKSHNDWKLPVASMPGDVVQDNGLHLYNTLPDHPIARWKHEGFAHNDFNREGLLTHMRSTEGPAMCVGDVTTNGLDDLFIGGARNQPGVLFIQSEMGEFASQNHSVFDEDSTSEDIDCIFFDANGNGLDDLYVVSGGNSFGSSSSAFLDRLYINDGTGNFEKSDQILPTSGRFDSGSVVKANDFTGNGSLDLFVGTRLQPFGTGEPVNGYLLANDGGGSFTDVTEKWAPDLLNIGMIADAAWADITGDSKKELIVVGEWMPVTVFQKSGDTFVDITKNIGLEHTKGWWNSVETVDMNGNGRLDLVLGGHGQNSMFDGSKEYPLKMWVGDFANNGVTEQVKANEMNGKYYPVAHRHEMIAQIPSLREKYPDYANFAGQTVHEIFTPEQLSNSLVKEAQVLSSIIIWNREDSGMEIEKLPLRTQLSPVYGIHANDITGDGRSDIVLGGNLFGVKPRAGSYDAGRGTILTYYNGELSTISPANSGINAVGEVRNITSITKADGTRLTIIARFNDHPLVYEHNHQTE